MAKKSSSSKAKISANPSVKATWLSIFDKSHIWEDKDDVLDMVYWWRQVLAVIMGIIWGLLGFTGLLGILSFVILNSIAAYAIANNTGYDFDSDDNFLSVKEGFMTTFASFLVMWIVTYTATHFSDV